MHQYFFALFIAATAVVAQEVPRPEVVREDVPAEVAPEAPKAVAVEEGGEQVTNGAPISPAAEEAVKPETGQASPSSDEEVVVEVKAVPAEGNAPAGEVAAPPVTDGDVAIEARAVPREARSGPPPINSSASAKDKDKIAVSLTTDPDARPVSLGVPAPRGLIVDRDGKPLAQNIVRHYGGISMPVQEGLSDEQVLAAVAAPLAWCKSTFKNDWKIDEQEVIKHYQKRRWLPIFSDRMLSEELVDRVSKRAPEGVVFRPFYVRNYPEREMACHLLGYTKKTRGFPNGEIEPEEPMWPPTEGTGGLEKRFDKELSGQAGVHRTLYDAKGNILSEVWASRPRAGATVVTSLDLGFQKICEANLSDRGIRGAIVVMEIKTGDIVAAASNPGFDINNFALGVSQEYLDKLNASEVDAPQYCRSLAGAYPPASTFKIVTALAGLESQKLNPDTQLKCPAFIDFGGHKIWNASNKAMGELNVVSALKFSCNTWMVKAAQAAGGDAMTSMATRLGFGEIPGVGLSDVERAGKMPTPEFYMRKGMSMTGGNLGNVSIGQGEVEASPLQVCQMMAAVARGDAVPRPRLIKHIQDVDGHITQYFPPSVRSTLSISPENLEAVRRGMRAVVDGAGGTGSRAENRYVPTAGKTGTGQWKPNQFVVWFAGYLPYGNPEYAFAAVREGRPGESSISGGKQVAPIVASVFNQIYALKYSRGDRTKKKKKVRDANELAAAARRSGRSRETNNDEEDSEGDEASGGEGGASSSRRVRRVRRERERESVSSSSSRERERDSGRERESSGRGRERGGNDSATSSQRRRPQARTPSGSQQTTVRRAQPVEPAKKPSGLRGFFRRLGGKKE